MSRRHSHYFKPIDAVSMGASIVGSESVVDQCDKATFHAKWTGTPTGEIIVEANLSDDPSGWYQITLTGQVQPSGSAGEYEIILSLCHKMIRVSYNRDSGDGSLTIEMRMVSIGA